MNLFLYIIIFITGTVFGSFYTLATYRIPLRQDITHTRSYCPNCGHKLGFFELIPIWSYIFLGGKCHNCKQKIHIRYLIIEFLSGLCFLIIAKGMNITVYNININVIFNLILWVLYITLIFLVSGIDKKNRNIEKPVLIYGVIISIIYIAYQFIYLKQNSIQNIIYALLCIMLMINNKKKLYIYDILVYILIMAIFTGEICVGFTVATAIIAIVLFKGMTKIRYRKQEKQIKPQNISIAFFLGVINLIISLVAIMLV